MRLITTKSFEIAINEYGDNSSEKFCILMPGRLDTKDYINFVSHGKFLARLGYHVVAIDPPYTWDSPGDLRGYTTSAYVRAINELIEYFGNKKTTLVGHSRGGATAMLSSNNKHIKGIVLVNAAYGSPTPPDKSRLKGGCLLENRDIPPGNKRTKKQIEFMLPMEYFKDGESHDPIDALKAFDGAKLIIHANQDEFVSLDKVKTVFAELSGPKTFLKIDCTHDYRLFPKVIEQVNKSLKKFIESNMA